MGPRTHCFPYQGVKLQTYGSRNTFFNDKSAILLHPRTRRNKIVASQRQNDAQKMQGVQVTKSDCCIDNVPTFSLTLLCDIDLLFTFLFFDCKVI